MRHYLSILLISALSLQHSIAQYDPHKIEPFIQKYCADCHNAQKQKGDIRLDQIDTFDPKVWQLVYDQLYHQEMPPSEKIQPSKQETDQLMAYILKQTENKETPTSTKTTGYRKLNHREYNYTIKDLLGLNDGDFRPGAYIYSDTVEKGFDTEAESLVMSSDLLLEYMTAAEKSINQALFTENYNKPAPETHQVNLASLSGGDRRFTSSTKDTFITRDGGAKLINKGDEAKIKISGNYRVTIEAEPIDQFKYKNGTVFPPFTSALQLDLGTIAHQSGGVKKTFELENKKTTYTYDLWIDNGYKIFIAFANGAQRPANKLRQAHRANKLPKDTHILFPGIRITDIKVEGPFVNEWPPPSYQTTLGRKQTPNLDDQKTRAQILHRFMARAYRRPPTKNEINGYTARLNKEYNQSKSWHQAFIKTFSAMIVSPEFLYIKTGQDKLNEFELASRISYFFWSSMPDLELFNLAAQGRLSDPKILKLQIDRLFDDPKSKRFIDSFATQWLSLDKLGTMPPDVKGPYKAYYKISNDLKQETIQYFDHVLTENKSVREFIDSDYTFLNKSLADFYKIPFNSRSNPNSLQKTTLPADSIRGGIITQASILTLTANGVETTPIERGHWILDEFMGTPPPPPPEEVPALVPDLRKVTTVREQLLKHREDINCRECHLKMDPPGFALEAFDPIGRFRNKYDNKLKIETDGEFLGTSFQDIKDFKNILNSNDHIIARNLIIKIAEYAKGRKLNLRDLKTVKEIETASAKNDHQFKTMLELILTSELITHH